jgi:hypothetical protein
MVYDTSLWGHIISVLTPPSTGYCPLPLTNCTLTPPSAKFQPLTELWRHLSQFYHFYVQFYVIYLSLALATALRFCDPTGRYESLLTQQRQSMWMAGRQE